MYKAVQFMMCQRYFINWVSVAKWESKLEIWNEKSIKWYIWYISRNDTHTAIRTKNDKQHVKFIYSTENDIHSAMFIKWWLQNDAHWTDHLLSSLPKAYLVL